MWFDQRVVHYELIFLLITVMRSGHLHNYSFSIRSNQPGQHIYIHKTDTHWVLLFHFYAIMKITDLQFSVNLKPARLAPTISLVKVTEITVWCRHLFNS